MTRQTFHVAIIGAGLGGLCLAQALHKQGISFAVYERDAAADSRRQGYRIRIDETGQRALAAALPSELNRLFRQTCAVSGSAGQFLDPQLAPVGGRPSETWQPSIVTDGDRAADPVGDLSANRQTLREILLSGIADRVHFGRGFHHVEQADGGGVAIWFDDGSACDADLLVAADGVTSVVCRQRFPRMRPIDTGAACIYGKAGRAQAAAVADVLLSGTSVIFADDFAVIVDAMSFRFPVDAIGLTPAEDYLYWAVIGPRAVLGLHDDRLGQRDGMTLRAVVERLAAPWAEGLRALFAAADPSTVTALPIRSAGRLTPWTASRVTALGDAIHAMSPAGGVGANTALDDAVCLAGLLAGVSDAGIPLLEAIAAYEDDMRRRANAAIEASTQGARRLFREAVASL